VEPELKFQSSASDSRHLQFLARAPAPKWFGPLKTENHGLICAIVLVHQYRWNVEKWYIWWIVGHAQKVWENLIYTQRSLGIGRSFSGGNSGFFQAVNTGLSKLLCSIIIQGCTVVFTWWPVVAFFVCWSFVAKLLYIIFASWFYHVVLLFKYVLSMTGVTKESISKFLIGNRFHVKLRILSPYLNRILKNLEDSIWKKSIWTEDSIWTKSSKNSIWRFYLNKRRVEKSAFEDQSEEISVWIIKWTTLLGIFCKISFTPVLHVAITYTP